VSLGVPINVLFAVVAIEAVATADIMLRVLIESMDRVPAHSLGKYLKNASSLLVVVRRPGQTAQFAMFVVFSTKIVLSKLLSKG
jgi:hypothetical protein